MELPMYGINNRDIEIIDNKIVKQKNFLTDFTLDFGDKQINMLENTYSANVNPKKYFAEINNRVNTMFTNAKNLGLKPIFLTITAPSRFHYKSAKIFCVKTKKPMAIYSYGIDYIDNNSTAKELSLMWHKFTSTNIFRKMRKDTNIKLHYFRVYEPMKSGVPHIHAIMFLNPKYILPIKKKFYSFFTDLKIFGNSKKSLDFRYNFSNQKGGAVAYIMKYILKSFKNDSDNTINLSVYWYVKHNIRRFLSSRSLVPLFIYRKVRYYFKELSKDDFMLITDLYNNNQIVSYFDKNHIYYRFYDKDDKITYKELYSKNTDTYLSTKKPPQKIILSYHKAKTNDYEYKSTDYSGIEHYIPEKTNTYNGFIIIPSKLTDLQLFNYYYKLTVSTDFNPIHFTLVKNEMIKRDLLVANIESLNFDNIDYEF